MKPFILISVLLFIIFSCSESQEKKQTQIHSPSQRDHSINISNAYNNIFIDSITVENFINSGNISSAAAELIRDFYHSRNYEMAWFDEDGMTEQARVFWNLHRNYVEVQDSSLYDQWLHRQMQMLIEDEPVIPDDSTIIRTELELTDHFFRYAKVAFRGTIDPKELGWHIPRKKIDAVKLLDSLVATNGREMDNWVPINPQYNLIKQKLLQYYDIEKAGGWPVMDMGSKKILRQGDSAAVIMHVKKRLAMTNDFAQHDSTALFSSQLEEAVKHFQQRHGLQQDGVIGPNTIAAMNIPVKTLMEKIMMNMERMRWLPQQPAGTYVLVNIPEFELRVFENDKQVKKMKIIVGKQGHSTQVFSDMIEYVVFRPYWNIPRSIVRNEILPAMQQNKNYLAANNMEIVRHQNGLPVIRQRPGPGNALGKVKFLFPNNYSIYLHDTPAKSLFDHTHRAFSHGCIRIHDPAWMAEWLLRNQDSWTTNKVRTAMNSGNNNTWITLKEKVPVLITYFTVWVNQDDEINFRKDIYNHDKKLAAKMFE